MGAMCEYMQKSNQGIFLMPPECDTWYAPKTFDITVPQYPAYPGPWWLVLQRCEHDSTITASHRPRSDSAPLLICFSPKFPLERNSWARDWDRSSIMSGRFIISWTHSVPRLNFHFSRSATALSFQPSSSLDDGSWLSFKEDLMIPLASSIWFTKSEEMSSVNNTRRSKAVLCPAGTPRF